MESCTAVRATVRAISRGDWPETDASGAALVRLCCLAYISANSRSMSYGERNGSVEEDLVGDIMFCFLYTGDTSRTMCQRGRELEYIPTLDRRAALGSRRDSGGTSPPALTAKWQSVSSQSELSRSLTKRCMIPPNDN